MDYAIHVIPRARKRIQQEGYLPSLQYYGIGF
jgi:hypothetical protein